MEGALETHFPRKCECKTVRRRNVKRSVDGSKVRDKKKGGRGGEMVGVGEQNSAHRGEREK